MSAIKWLNNLLFMENLLGIYRNYCIQKKIRKYFIIFNMFFQTVLYSMVIITKQYLFFRGDVVVDQVIVIYSVLSATAYINWVSILVTSICYSRAFMSYYKSITRLSDWFKDDKHLMKSLKKIYWFSIIITLIAIAFVVIRSLEVLIKLPQINEFLNVLIFVGQTIMRVSIMYQNIMLVVVIMIVVCLFKSLNSSISAVQERLGSGDISSEEQCDVSGKQIQEWFPLYQDLANCCEKVTLCFGRQYFFSLVLSMPSHILMLYQICYQIGTSKEPLTNELIKVIVAIFSYVATMLMPFAAGQFAHNQGQKFHRVLARLYNSMIIIDFGETKAKLIKDFMRLIKNNPIEIKLWTKIPAGMYMMPVILTLAVNYVIVLLQFNHVI